jgi:predicted DNA-binding transcriptional regulator AlpA
MSAKTTLNSLARPLPTILADVALIAADTCAAIGDVSVSWWHQEVRTDRAPKPVIQQPRFTRWRLADVRRFWAERAAQAEADTAAGERMAARAKKASVKAREPAAVAKAQATRKARIAAREGAAT